MITDLDPGLYSIVVTKNDLEFDYHAFSYHDTMINVQVSSPILNLNIPIFHRATTPSEANQLKFVLFQYSYTMDLDLYAIFETSNGDCIVSYFNVYCGGMKYSFFTNNERQPRYSSLTLEKTGNFRYLFFVKAYNYRKNPPFNSTVIMSSPNVQMYNSQINNNLASV